MKALAERLAAMGHDVTVLAGEPDAEAPREEIRNGVRVVRWPTLSPGGAYHMPRKRTALEMWLAAQKPDVVHIHGVHAVFTVHVGARLAGRGKIVLSPHYHGGGHTWFRELLWRLYWRRAVEKVFAKSSAIHVVSHVEAESLAKHFPAAKAKIRIIPNGVDEDTFSYRWAGAHSDYAMYSGRLEKYKKLDEAAALVRKLGLRFVVVGEGPAKRRLERHPWVEVKPFLTRRDYLTLLAGARYAINLSARETFSVFVAEALTVGVPSIVSEVVAKALEAEIDGRMGDAVVATKAAVRPWSELMPQYLKLYG